MKPVLLLAALFLFSPALFAQSLPQRLDHYFDSIYQKQDPGAAIAVVRNGKLIFSKGYGLATLNNTQRITTATPFNIGSITKQFTAICILQLAEQGKLSLNDPLSKFFTGFGPRTASITIRQLLTHSSGIVDHYGHTDLAAVKHATDIDVLHAVQPVDSTYFTPGTAYRYSNTAYCLLALIIEKISGDPYREYVRKHIFRPLHMDHSQVLDLSQPVAGKALGYERNEPSASFHPLDAAESVFFSTEGDGGIYTTIDDYLKWLNALNSGSLLPKNWIAKARSAEFPVDPAQKLAYGFGWFISDKANPPAVYHTGSNGGFRAFVYTIPAIQYAVVIFSNRSDIALEDLIPPVNRITGVTNNSFTKIESLVSFIRCWPNFAPCKETPLFLTSSEKNLNASATALN